MLWLFVVGRAWVRVPAEAYADRLLESVEVLRQHSTVPAQAE